MGKRLDEIAEHLGGELIGDGSVKIVGVAGIEDAQTGDLTFLVNPKYKPFLQTTSASAIVVGGDMKTEGAKKPLIRHSHPYLAFARAIEFLMETKRSYEEGVHPSAVLGERVKIDKGAHVGPLVVLDDGAYVKRNAVVLAGSFIGADSVVGEKSFVHPNVTIRENVEIGSNVIIHSGTVIGSDGFGYAKENKIQHKIPQVGGVKIEDDVEIGANVTIDRATLGVTRIGKGSKIDNLVQIAHNVEIGENCTIVSQVGISGSTKLGDEVVLAGQVGLVGHLKIGNRVTIGAQSGVTKDIPDGTVMFGYPAREIHKTKRIEAYLSRLHIYLDRLKELEKELEKMKSTSR